MARNRTYQVVSAAAIGMLALILVAGTGFAGETGHFCGGAMNIRDYRIPDPGFYAVLYNYFYTSKRVNDANGDQISSFTIATQKIGINMDLNAYALMPAVMWVTEIKSLGLCYGAFAALTLTNSDFNADVTSAFGNRSFGSAASFGLGDILVEPIWIGKSVSNWYFGLSYGFYAPVGRYGTQVLTVPQVGPITVEKSDNLGLGFWTHQIQGCLSWSTLNKATAVVVGMTYELNSKKKDFNLTPGNCFTVNYGISQYLPLSKDQSMLLELGPAGYDTWQVSEDKGSSATTTLDQVHALGAQLGAIYVPWATSIVAHAFFSFAAKDRPQGPSYGVSIAKAF